MYKFVNYKKSDDINKLIDFAVPIIDFIVPVRYSPNRKYDNRYFFTCIIDFLNNSTYWTRYNGTIDYPIDGKYLNEIHNKYIKHKVYEEINKQLLIKYLKKNKAKKLKYQMIDSSFIANKKGNMKINDYLLNDTVKKKNEAIKNYNVAIEKELIKENKKLLKNKKNNIKKKKKEENFIDYNRYNGRKKYLKISTITDTFGTPLASTIISSKQSDSISITETLNKIPIDINTKKSSFFNRYKQYMLADSGYCSKNNSSFLKKRGYIPLINYNKRNTKDKNIIKLNEFNKDQKKKYKGRTKIESFFSWIKNYPCINQNYQKKVTSYHGLVLLASSIIISKRI
jgi:Transposase DDE domain